MNPLDNILNFIEKSAVFVSSGKTANLIARTAEVSDKRKKLSNRNTQFGRSIRGRADEFILQYPLVTSNSVSSDTVEIIRNQVELERATELSISLTNNPIQTYTANDPDGAFLKDLHTNINLNDSYINNVKNMEELNEDLLRTSDELFNSKSINEYTLPRDFLIHLYEEDEKKEEEKKKEKPIFPEYRNRDGIKTSDISKQNKSLPLTMSARVKYKVESSNLKDEKTGKGHTDIIDVDILFGIKSVVHLVDSEDVVFFLSDSAKHSNLLTKLVKLTTGEVSLVRDILFRQDRAKRAATSTRRKNNVWKNLTVLADTENAKSFFNRHQGKMHDEIIPTTTLLLSTDEVDMIQRNTGRNILTDSIFSDTVYRELLLLDMLVVDEANSILYKYDPKNKVFDRVALSSLEGNRMSDSKKSKESDPEEILKIMKRLRG